MKKIDDQMLQEILTEMLRRVNAKETYDKMDFNEENWYEKYQWTMKEQEDFQIWLGKYFVEHKVSKKGKYRNQNAGLYDAGMFIFNYGWKGIYEW